VKPEISSVEVHPQLSHYTGIPMDDDALEGGGSFWLLTGYNGYEWVTNSVFLTQFCDVGMVVIHPSEKEKKVGVKFG